MGSKLGRWWPLVVVATACLLASGCGDGSEASDDSAEVRSLAHEVQRALSQRDCATLRKISGRSVSAQGSFVGLECPSRREAKGILRNFEVTDAVTYGTGGAVEYRSRKAPDGSTMLMFRAPGAQWALSVLGLAAADAIGTPDDASRPGFARAVDRYLAAVRDNDCKRFFAYAATRFTKRKAACRWELATLGDLRAALRENRRARPTYLGGNRQYGFYRLTTRRPQKIDWTVTVLRTPRASSPYLVLNAAQSTVGTPSRKVD